MAAATIPFILKSNIVIFTIVNFLNKKYLNGL